MELKNPFGNRRPRSSSLSSSSREGEPPVEEASSGGLPSLESPGFSSDWELEDEESEELAEPVSFSSLESPKAPEPAAPSTLALPSLSLPTDNTAGALPSLGGSLESPRPEAASTPKAAPVKPLRDPALASPFAKLSNSIEPTIDELLATAVTAGASDIHMHVGAQPRMRHDGELKPMEGTLPLTEEWLLREMEKIAAPAKWREYVDTWELDFSHRVPDYGRFRVNYFKQAGTPAIAFRTIPEIIRTTAELGLPDTINNITRQPNGLVLVTGPTGSGKSSTLAAMIEMRNREFQEHIMTIEDPVEFVYKEKKAYINQREVGADTASFQEALKRVLREDPEVILIGELRDPETISIALTAAETGHLVFGTLHTQSASKSINRLVDSFPAHQQSQIRSQLSDTLRAIISQTLLKKEGGGRVVATEILVRNNAIANQIREGQTSQIYSSLQNGRAEGMHTLDQDLKRLLKDGLISREVAYERVTDESALRGL